MNTAKTRIPRKGLHTTLTYDNQLEFKKYAKRWYGLDSNLYYFDDIDCVDAKTNRTIRDTRLPIKCNGNRLWCVAADLIKEHFGIK